jgi:hypothetical protein
MATGIAWQIVSPCDLSDEGMGCGSSIPFCGVVSGREVMSSYTTERGSKVRNNVANPKQSEPRGTAQQFLAHAEGIPVVIIRS